MNYWLLTTEYPPQHGGGISTYCYYTCRMLTAVGYVVTVFVPDDTVGDYVIVQETDAIVVRFNPDRCHLQNALGYTARLSYAFADIVKFFIQQTSKPDYIEVQDYLGIGYYLTQYKHLGYSFLKDIPIVLTLHSPAFIYLEYNRVPHYRFPDFWTCEMEKQTIKAADAIIAPTRFMLDEVKKAINLDDKIIEIIPNPYELDHEVHNLSLTPDKIICFGKLSPQKGTFELLEYFEELWDNGFPHPLYLLGGTDIVYHPEMKTMGQLIEKKYKRFKQEGLLKMEGKIKPSQIRQYLQDARVIIIPSIIDNLPYAVMEAMSLGKVVLTSRQGGQREMIEDGVTGFLFTHEDPESFEIQLLKILSLSHNKLIEIGIRARQYVGSRYAYENVGSAKHEFLQRLKSSPLTEGRFSFLYQEEIQPPDRLPSIVNLLSVVIPYHNMGDYIEACIDSVNNSTWKNIEIVIVNDGSTDNASLDKLISISVIKNVRVVHQHSKGLAETRNHGAKLAKGEYLAFIDPDDKVDPTYYEKAIHVMKKNLNVFFVGAWVKYFENSTKTWVTFTPQPPYALVHNPINSSSLVYKRYAFITGGLNDRKVDYGVEDYESVLNMLAHGFNGVVIPEVLFYYRVRSDSMFRKITNEKLLYSNKYIAQKHKGYFSNYAIDVINLLNANGPGYMFDNPTFESKVSTDNSNESAVLFTVKSIIKKNERLKKVALAIKKINS